MSIPGTKIELSGWQKKQAAMLYHFTSVEYLKTLHGMVRDLINGVIDPLLDIAKVQNRDQVLINKVWGIRNTSHNWANHAWPMLMDLQTSLAKDVARRASNRFRFTAVNECLRGMQEYSLDWSTPGEQEVIDVALATISSFASNYDKSVEEYVNSWTDFTFAYHYPEFAVRHTQIPKLTVRGDVRGETGKVPPKTGVYVCVDDSHAALQFAWTADGGAELREANTFNEVGLAALAEVGRKSLWFDEDKMYQFAMSEPYAPVFRDSVFRREEAHPELAPSAVARCAFKERSCEWALVEIIQGEFENLEALVEADATPETSARRIVGGERCMEAGFYFTPAVRDSRRFLKTGDIAPKIDSSYGVTYWQWDSNQT